MTKFFVLATEALGKRMWFSGLSDGEFGDDICLTEMFFGAFDFPTRALAQECLTELDLKGFEIAECEPAMSSSSFVGGCQ